MRKAMQVSTWIVLAVLAGCIPSLYPLHTDKDVVFDENLLGGWTLEDGKGSWVFEKAKENEYRLLASSKDDKRVARYAAHLFKLDGQLYIDLIPEKHVGEETGYGPPDFLPMHTWYRIDQLSPTLKMAGLHPTWLRKHLEAHPDALAHEYRNKALFLTAKTPELQAFVRKHRDDPEAFTKPLTFKRKTK